MTPKRSVSISRWILAASTLLLALALNEWFPAPALATRELPATSRQQTSTVPNITSETTTANGLTTVTLRTAFGRVSLNLPDDLAAGDTISGSVIAEPTGQTPTERQTNYAELVKKVAPEIAKLVETGFWFSPEATAQALPANFGLRLDSAKPLELWSGQNHQTVIPVLPAPVILPGSAAAFELPRLGQTGRPIQVPGPFDGDFRTTGATVGGRPANVLAESPRKAVFHAPLEPMGPQQINVTEQGRSASGEFRNLDVKLSSPKLALLRGEKTTLTIEVSGLQGLTQPVPLNINCSGAADLAGGNQQNVQLDPRNVPPNGVVTETRVVTGRQPGAFAVVANVQVANQPCALTNQIVHVEADPVQVGGGGDDVPVWMVKIKLQDGTNKQILIRSPQKPTVRFCNWILINNCKDGVVPPEELHGFERTKEPPAPRSATAAPSPSPTPDPRPTPKPSDPRSVSGGCKEGAFQFGYRTTGQPYNIVDENSAFSMTVEISGDQEGRQNARDLADWLEGVTTLGELLTRLAPSAGPSIGMSAGVASLLFEQVNTGAKILRAAAEARLTNADPTVFKVKIKIKTRVVTPFCDTGLYCRNQTWVPGTRYGQSDGGASEINITKTIEATGQDWNLVSTNEKFDLEKANRYVDGLLAGAFGGLKGNAAGLAAAPNDCQ